MAVNYMEFRHSRIRLWLLTRLSAVCIRVALWALRASLRSHRWQSSGRHLFTREGARKQAASSLARVCTVEEG